MNKPLSPYEEAMEALGEIVGAADAAYVLYCNINPLDASMAMARDGFGERNAEAFRKARALKPPLPEWAKQILGSRGSRRLAAADGIR